STTARPALPSITSTGVRSPTKAQASAGNMPQASTGNASDSPRRRITSARAAALNQNSRGMAAAMATARVASLRPRMLYSARPRMPLRYPLITGSSYCSATVTVGERQQSQVAGALDGDCQLTLVSGLCTGDTAGYDLAGFGDVGFQGVEIFVVDLFNAFSGETAELSATEKTCHGSVSF